MMRRRRVLSSLLSVAMAFSVVVGAYAPVAIAETASAYGFQATQEDSYPVAPGVMHKSMTLTDGEHVEAVNLMEIDPQNPNLKFEVTSPKGRVIALDTVRNQAKQIDREGYRVVGGFNMGFFNTDPAFGGEPVGLQISNGEVVTANQSDSAVFSVNADGQYAVNNSVSLNATIQADGSQAMRFSGINKPRTASATNHMYLYTSKFSDSTKSAGTGVEVVIAPESAKLVPGQALTGMVESVSTANNTPIPPGKWVLSASGTFATWAKSSLTAGKQVEVKLDFVNGLNNAVQAVSGNVMLVVNGQATANALADNVDRAPRTFLGIKQGKVYMITVDGRQPTYSDGVTIAEGAAYLQSLGMETAINYDGGGSTTYTLRQPGDVSLSVGNRPSDGFERAVSNALMVVSTAPVTDLAYLVPNPKGPIRVLAGSTVAFSAKEMDQSYNGLPVDPELLTWTADAAVGAVTPQGRFTAAGTPGSGHVTVSQGSVSQAVDVQVVSDAAKLELTPSLAIVNPGSTQAFSVKAHDANGSEVLLSPERVTWQAEGGIGTVSSDGVLTAASGTASGKLVATLGEVRAEATVNVGKPPVTVEDFEDITDLSVSNARANSVTLTLASRSNPVRFGTHSAKLAYDFTGQSGTSAAYVNFRDANNAIGRVIDGRPLEFGLWVYGDGKNHWLRGSYYDGLGTSKTLDFTAAGGLNWVGWKYVAAPVPSDAVLPLKLRQVYVVETSTLNKNAGAVYFDDLRAVYSDTGEDLVGPTFSSYQPAANQKVYTSKPTISAVVKDSGAGVDPGSLEMMLDGRPVAHQYDPATGLVSYAPDAALADGTHHVTINGQDKASNPALPIADWSFTVYTGTDQDPPTLSVIQPMDGTATRTNVPRIAVKLQDDYSGIDFSKSKLEVDGKDVAAEADPASGTLYYTPAAPWEEGSQHQAKATAVDKNNNTAATAWSFTVDSVFGQPKDPNHFQMSVIGDGGYYTAGSGTTAADILLREQISRINQEPSELVGYTGDIVENDTAANYAAALQNMQLFHAPYVVSIGNHEVSGTNSRANYEKTFGDPTYYYDYGNTRLIGLDSASGRITPSDASQWPWLKETLEQTPESQANIVVLMHIPPDEISADGVNYNTGHGFQDPQEAQKFYDLLGAYKAAHPDKQMLVLDGDLHAYSHKTVQGVEYVITGGGGKLTHLPPEQGGFYHYLNVKVDGGKMAWEVIPLLDHITVSSGTVGVGKQITLSAQGTFMTSSNPGMTLPVAAPFKAEWSSSDPNVATVDNNGTVTAVAPGTATITVKSGWREGSATVKVPTNLTSDLPGALTVREQNKYKVTTAVHPDDAGKNVQLRVTLLDKSQVSHIDLKHQDKPDGEYVKLRFDENGTALCNPVDGYPLASGTDAFMVKFDSAGTYDYRVELVSGADVLASCAQHVVVNEKH